MQPRQLYRHQVGLSVFQSSSGQKAGCNPMGVQNVCERHLLVSILIRPEGRMQLSESARPILFPGSTGVSTPVSILIRPEGRMQPQLSTQANTTAIYVSILIRPEGRMQRPLFVHSLVHRVGFNPHPARRPDATSATNQVDLRVYPLFQSSSGQKAGCNNYAAEGDGAVHRAVSILIRPEGRMQHDKG